MEIIDRIEKAMKNKGITAYTLEKDIGIRQTTFGGWKRGAQPPADKLLILMKYLNISPNELYGYEPILRLNENEREMLALFQELPEKEQVRFIVRIEDKLKELEPKEEMGKSLDTKIG